MRTILPGSGIPVPAVRERNDVARLRKTITITILPGVTEKSRQWTIPRWSIYLFVGGIFLVFTGVVFLVIFYSYETKKFMALQTIQEETRAQKEHLDHYRKELDSIEAQLSEVNNLDVQIMNMVAKGAPDVHLPSAETQPENDKPAPYGKKNSTHPVRVGPEPLSWSYDERGRTLGIPVDGWIVSTFGKRTGPIGVGEEFHPGLDIAQEEGGNVHSPASGVVILTDRTPDYGNYVIVYHGLGLSSLFAHLDQIDVVLGQSVDRHSQIGRIGLTGLTTAPHLHYELREFGHPVDPRQYLDGYSLVKGSVQ